jgi:hypothetical protein
MSVYVEQRFDGIVAVVAALERVQAAIISGTEHRLGRQLARESLDTVKRLTPRTKQRNRLLETKRGHRPLHSQWEVVEDLTTGTAYKAIVRNKARLTRDGLAVLASVEHGARPHAISPRSTLPRVALAWRQPGAQHIFLGRQRRRGAITDRFQRRSGRGGMRYAAYVYHPGMQSFRMVSQTRRHTQLVAARALRVFAQEIRREFAGLGISVR